VRAWALYAAAGLFVTLLGAGVGSLLLDDAATRALWFAALLAYGVQLVAFAALLLVRNRSELFLLGWLAGLALRFLVVLLVALWLSREPVFEIRPALVSLVAFVFVLLLLEPVFLRRGLQTR
jgi:hypothetical protein